MPLHIATGQVAKRDTEVEICDMAKTAAAEYGKRRAFCP